MKYLGLEKYACSERDFEIIVYRDNNDDRLQLDAHEVINGQRQAKVITTQYVPMEGNWLSPPSKYSEFPKTMAASKQAIIIYCAAEEAMSRPDADIF
jgi:hypothetical protein